MDIQIRRALLSCFDKTNLLPLARCLVEHGCELISTGGTQKCLEEANLPVTDISCLTQYPEAFSGRVKTISFPIAASLLFDRSKDQEEAKKYGIKAIDLVVCNFYPFATAEMNEQASFVELIDIGGPTMVRAAAKNFQYVTVLTKPEDYASLSEELNALNGRVSLASRRKLMAKAFNLVADYDSLIATQIDAWNQSPSVRLSFQNPQHLRYGENAHQKALLLQNGIENFHGIEVHQGKDLSYNNYLDMQAAFEAIEDLEGTACCIVKHNTPCGMAEGTEQKSVFELAWAGDSVSAFGSVIIFNRKLELSTAHCLNLDSPDKNQRKFVEIILAPSFADGTLDYLASHKNLRVISFKSQNQTQPKSPLNSMKHLRLIDNILLVQEKDMQLYECMQWVTQSRHTINEALVIFGLKAVKAMRSNAIAIVRMQKDNSLQVLGLGCGQPNRVTSVQLAIDKSLANLRDEFHGHADDLAAYQQNELARCLLISEAFFPFADNVEICAKFGIKTIVQPGGSIRDQEVIDACNHLGLAMLLTGLRHFKH